MSDTEKMTIPDEALDAAVDALVASRLGDYAGINGEDFVEAARAALEAAAPHMEAAVIDRLLEAGWQEPEKPYIA